MNKLRTLFRNCFAVFLVPRLGQRVLRIAIAVCFTLAVYMTFAFSARYPFNYIVMAVYAIMILLLLAHIVIYGRVFITYFAGGLVLLAILVLVSSLANGIRSLNMTVLFLIGTALVLYEFFMDIKNIHVFIYCFALGGILFLLHFCVHYHAQLLHPTMTNNTDRVGTFFGNQNDVGRYLSYIVLCLFYLTAFRKQYWLVIPMILGSYLLLSTGSISNLLTVLLTCGISLFALNNQKRRLVVLLGIGVVGMGVYFLLSLPQFAYFKVRLNGILSSLLGVGDGYDMSASTRFSAALYGLLSFFEHPLFGSGADSLVRSEFFIMPHNNIVALLGDYGFFSALLWEAGLIYALIFAIKNKEDQKARFVFVYALFMVIFQVFLVSVASKVEYLTLPILFTFVGSKQRNLAYFVIPIAHRRHGYKSSITI